MLLSAVSLAIVLAAHVANAQNTCPYLGTAAPHVNGTNNYVIDKFQSLLSFTFAINQCTAITAIASSWYKYSCLQSDGVWSVTKYSYSDAECTQDEATVTTWNAGDVTEGNVGYFVCDGDNTYVKVEIGVSCQSTQSIYAGLNGCAYNTPTPTKFYCDKDKALVELFLANYPPSRRLLTDLASTTEIESSTTDMESSTTDMETSTTVVEETTTKIVTTTPAPTAQPTTPPPTTPAPTEAPLLCDSHLYCNAWSFNATCKAILAIPVNGKLTSIYGKFDDCFLGIKTTAAEGGNGNSGAASLFVITNLVVAVVVALFSMF